MKKRLISIILSFTMAFSVIGISSVSSYADSVISKGAGFESMYAEWNGNNSTSYTVYYKESSDTNYIKIDDELVREVNGGKFRADVLGLKGNTSYDVKVEGNGETVMEFTDTPMAYDRSGFAFSSSNALGAYNMDGTPESNALIIYASEENKTNVYNNKSLTSILGGLNSLNGGNPVIIRIIGKVTPVGSSTSPGMWKNTCGVTIEGVGVGAGLYGWGIGSGDNKDTEFRNLNFADYVEDAIGFENAENLWVHNNTFYSGYNPNDSTAERDKLHGDGSCDLRECNNVTVSYNHFNNTDKTSLIGSSASSRESTGNITFHHNFFDGTSQRTPRVRWHNIHVYNNYYLNTKTYGIGATCNSSIFAENNYFEDASSPFLTSSQGGYASKFSDNEGGVIKAYNNTLVNTRESLEGVDYFNAPSRDYRMTASDFTTVKGGWTYNNFDATGYIAAMNYNLDSPENAKAKVLELAGASKNTGISYSNEITPPSVDGYVSATYYYDPEPTGTTGGAFGGLNGNGTYFTGNGTNANKTATGYRGTEQYNYNGSFSSGSTISFTTENPAKFTIICSTDGNTPLRMTLTNSQNSDAVYHGTFQSGNKGNDVLTTIDCLEAGTYSFKANSSVDIYYIEVAEYNGEVPPTESTQTTTSISTELTTEVTTISESTTETTTTEPTTTNVVSIELGEAQTGFESDTANDTGAGTSVTYNKETDTWYLTDTSSTAAAALTIPFEKQLTGKIVISGSAVPSANASKWGIAQIRGLANGSATEISEIIGIGSDANKNLAVRTYDENGLNLYTGFGQSLGANTTYNYEFVIDLDNKQADVTVNGQTLTVPFIGESISAFYTTTSKKSSRNISVTTPRVGLVSDEVITETSTEETTEQTTETSTEETTSEPNTPPVTEVVYGDADGDGVVSSNDIVVVIQNILCNNTEILNSGVVDVNKDGKIDSTDAAHILQKTLDNSYVMPIEK
ncbi:MAG: dockerin type I domain-containing protein [Lachnospirales bacterium]